jgi:acyl-CoA synthetase (AMP-forming)/AMP-acid ligase II
LIVAGGVNIYPAEIEKVLVQHPAVVDAAVIGIPQDDFGEQPMAFIVAAPAAELTEEGVLEFLRGRLASYKKPRRFAFVDQLPVNPMGKVLKNVLRGRAAGSARSGSAGHRRRPGRWRDDRAVPGRAGRRRGRQRLPGGAGRGRRRTDPR